MVSDRTVARRRASTSVAGVMGLGLAACLSGGAPAEVGDAGAEAGDAGAEAGDAGAEVGDAGVPSPDAAVSDVALSPTGLPCECSEADQVFRWHPCTPTRELGCGATCDPDGGTTECPGGHVCEGCAASTSCGVKDCRSACVLGTSFDGPVPDVLRLVQNHGRFGEEHTTAFEGARLTVGALFHAVVLGPSPGSEGDPVAPDGPPLEGAPPGLVIWDFVSKSACHYDIRLPARGIGTAPLWVSQYGGGGPWALAGFFHWTADGEPAACAQPGLACEPTRPCCATADVPMACVSGRCEPLP